MTEGTGMLIRALRLERGWSQETLAEISGLSVRTIQRIERGAPASLETRNALASALGLDVAELTDLPELESSAEDRADSQDYVREVKGFYMHFGTYVFVILLLAFLWFIGDNDHPWFFWPAFGWGIGVFAHWVAITESLPFFGPDWEQRQIEKRMRRKGQT